MKKSKQEGVKRKWCNMRDKGWICLWRKITQWGWYHDVNTRVTFIHCLLMANYEDNIFQGELIKRGSFVTSYSTLSQQAGISIQQLRTALNHLKSTHELTIKTTNKFTIITVENYDLYQTINIEDNNQLTNDQQTTNKQLTTIKQYNNITNNNITSNNITTTTNARELNNLDLFSFIEQVFGRTLSGSEFEIISLWEDNELTRYAIKQAELARVFNIRYIERILESYKKDNITTVIEAEERDRRYREKKENKTKPQKKTVQEELRELREKYEREERNAKK